MSRLTTLQKTRRSAARRARAVAPVAADAREATIRAADATRDWAAPKVESAVDWAAPRVGSAKEWAAPKVEPAIEKVKADLLPVVTGAIATALAATEPQRKEMAGRGAAALAALRGEVAAPKPKRHRLRTVLLLVSVAGAVWAAWKGWVARREDPVDAWTTPSTRSPSSLGSGSSSSAGSEVGAAAAGSAQAASEPSAASLGSDLSDDDATTGTAATTSATGGAAGGDPVPGDATASGTAATDDPGGAAPGEALADAADEASDRPPASTTEAVTPEQAKKVSQASAKGRGRGTPSTS